MQKLTIYETHYPHALLATRGEKQIEVAGFETKAGDKIISNADLKPFSPVDGTPMQMLSSKRLKFGASQLAAMVGVGSCQACGHNLLATASLADHIDTSGAQIHCPFCATPVTAAIDSRQLI